jgi:hypothetical protein
VFVAHPPIERARRHDRDQLFDGASERFAKLKQSLPLFRLGVNLALDPFPQDLVLFLQELDILRQLSISSGSNERQQGVENLRCA